MESIIASQLRTRLSEHARVWCVAVEHTVETESSVIAFGKRGSQPVVLKVLKQPGDEWHSGETLKAFDGKGVARVYEHVEGAILLERLSPGTSLVSMALDGKDDEATLILAEVIQKMFALESARTWTTVHHWTKSFEVFGERR